MLAADERTRVDEEVLDSEVALDAEVTVDPDLDTNASNGSDVVVRFRSSPLGLPSRGRVITLIRAPTFLSNYFWLSQLPCTPSRFRRRR